MDVHQYEYLLTIANCRNLSKAAKVLGISQPSLSAFLKKTEFLLGHQLFLRQGHTLIPTEAGTIYLDTCQRILDIKHQTYAAINQTMTHTSQSFTLGVSPYMGSQIFSQIFPIFHRRFPDVTINLVEGYSDTMTAELQNGQIDLALSRFEPGILDTFDVISITREELLLCVPIYHPMASLSSDIAASCATATLDHFDDIPFAQWGRKTTARKIIDRYLKKNHYSITTVYEANNALSLDILLQNNIGAGFLPAGFCLPNKNRVYFSLNPPLFSLAGLMCRKGYVLSKPERYLVYLISKNRMNPSNIRNSVQHFNDQAKAIIAEFESEPSYATTYTLSN